MTRMIVYTHFESKTALYRAVLDRMRDHAEHRDRSAGLRPRSASRALLSVAAAEPAGFRLLFHHAAREPEFRADVDHFRGRGVEIARTLPRTVHSGHRAGRLGQHLIPTVMLEAVIAWLDAGLPDRDGAADRIRDVIQGVVDAASKP